MQKGRQYKILIYQEGGEGGGGERGEEGEEGDQTPAGLDQAHENTSKQHLS